MIPHPTRALVTAALTAAVSAAMCPALAAPAVPVMRSAGLARRPLHARTLTDLSQSMRGEAFANASYRFFAAQGRREGLAAVANLFQRTVRVELREHFTEEAALRGLVGSDAANLRDAISGETYESRVMYPRFARQARQDRDFRAAGLFAEIAKDQAVHRAAFVAALHALRTGRGRIPAPPSVESVAVPAGLPKVASRRTKANLDAAMHGEALAYAKYTLYADHARRYGHAALARLFTGNAAVELNEHFAGEAAFAGLVRRTRVNLGTAITGERYESRRMYPSYAMRADRFGDLAAARLFRHNAADEAKHARAFAAARRTVR